MYAAESCIPAMLNVKPKIEPPFDPHFRPIVLAWRGYQEEVKKSGKSVALKIGIERENGFISIFEMEVLCRTSATADAGVICAERIIKFLLWSRGGWKIYLQGPREIGEYIRKCYSETGDRSFDVKLMSRVYERPFQVMVVDSENFPAPKEGQSALGGHLEGCRIGFDLGASDYKVAAVLEGEPVYSEEIPWNPSEQSDSVYHYGHIQDGLKKAAFHLPRIDAIGGSAAGIYINNQVRISSLFRGRIPPDVFEKSVKNMFLRMQAEWRVPFEVINDGEVAALTGTLSLGEKAMLGVAMGSSQAVGFQNADGHIQGWLDELAFVPVDIGTRAAVDEWSGDRGIGAMYFSQQAVNKLALNAGFVFEDKIPLSERLQKIQELAEKNDERACRIFEAVGVYLGYTIPYYEMFYDYRNLLLLGRVMSGKGGDIIFAKAQEVLRSEFPETEARTKLHLQDERSRRVGQAVAAASLPKLK